MLSFFPLDVLDEIWDVTEAVSEGFLTYSYEVYDIYILDWGWSGGVMALGNLPVPGLPTFWMVGQWPITLAVGAGGVVRTCLLSSVLSQLFLPLSGRRPDID